MGGYLMASLIPSGSASGTGSMTIAAPVTNSNQTATLPDATGQIMVNGNMPAFSAYGNTNQVISSNATTKVIINNKTFDTATAFDATTNYRFTPQVAGYYQINGIVEAYAGGVAITSYLLFIYKNGAEILRGTGLTGPTATEIYATVNGLFYMNGTTDYLELYMYTVSTGTITLYGSNPYKTFSGCLVSTA
jgi:hypothetical protein